MKILAVSDARLPKLNNPEFLRSQYGDVELVISCGDMDADYLDFIASVLSAPMFYVRGNHDHNYDHRRPGGIDLHRRIVNFKGLNLAGLEGSILYNNRGVQYSEVAMTGHILMLMPRLWLRRMIQQHGTDVLVAHSPPRHINDLEDHPHRGFKVFRWLIRTTRPRYFIHGHVDIYDQRIKREAQYYGTRVININPSMMLELGETED